MFVENLALIKTQSKIKIGHGIIIGRGGSLEERNECRINDSRRWDD
jgi:hypothetical protein